MIIESLLDNDLYKFTMQQAFHHNFPESQSVHKFILRSEDVDLLPYKKQIEEEIEHMCSLKFQPEELTYLESLGFFKPDYLDYLEDLRLKTKGMKITEESGKLAITYRGSLVQKILFEVPIMSIISESYLKDKIDKKEAFKNGYNHIKEKIAKLDEVSHFVNFADFGTRRRFSREWHDAVIVLFKELVPDNFIGTSNLFLAKKYNLKPIGTMAHEWIQAGQAIGGIKLVDSQKHMFETWVKEYRGELGILLTDTIGMSSFLRDFDKYFAKLYDGCRHDSSDPYSWGDQLIKHYENFGIDPMSKTAVFSDGLNFDKMIAIDKYFHGRIKVSHGVGTNVTNDVGVKPLSMVIKLIHLNGNPVAKISDEPAKAICEDPEFLSYLKKVYLV